MHLHRGNRFLLKRAIGIILILGQNRLADGDILYLLGLVGAIGVYAGLKFVAFPSARNFLGNNFSPFRKNGRIRASRCQTSTDGTHFRF